MPAIDPSAVPGLMEAVAREQINRDAAFLPINETICGFELLPMTLRHYVILLIARNPLLGDAVPSPVQLAQFLWILSPDYSPKGGFRRWRILRRCRKLIPKGGKNSFKQFGRVAEVIEACRKYVDDTFSDTPSRKPSNGFKPSHCSDAATICACFAREFGWKDEYTLSMPLKRIFQYLRDIQRHHDPKIPQFSAADRCLIDWANAQKGARN